VTYYGWHDLPISLWIINECLKGNLIKMYLVYCITEKTFTYIFYFWICYQFKCAYHLYPCFFQNESIVADTMNLASVFRPCAYWIRHIYLKLSNVVVQRFICTVHGIQNIKRILILLYSKSQGFIQFCIYCSIVF
jgi:hypothetical protein